jgi:hypothetical protein
MSYGPVWVGRRNQVSRPRQRNVTVSKLFALTSVLVHISVSSFDGRTTPHISEQPHTYRQYVDVWLRWQCFHDGGAVSTLHFGQLSQLVATSNTGLIKRAGINTVHTPEFTGTPTGRDVCGLGGLEAD